MKSKPWNDPAVVKTLTPIITTTLLEIANAGQIIRMWTVKSALGQSLSSWLFVCAALILWWNFYRVNKLTVAKWATTVGITFNVGVWSSIIYFRYFYA